MKKITHVELASVEIPSAAISKAAVSHDTAMEVCQLHSLFRLEEHGELEVNVAGILNAAGSEEVNPFFSEAGNIRNFLMEEVFLQQRPLISRLSFQVQDDSRPSSNEPEPDWGKHSREFLAGDFRSPPSRKPSISRPSMSSSSRNHSNHEDSKVVSMANIVRVQSVSEGSSVPNEIKESAPPKSPPQSRQIRAPSAADSSDEIRRFKDSDSKIVGPKLKVVLPSRSANVSSTLDFEMAELPEEQDVSVGGRKNSSRRSVSSDFANVDKIKPQPGIEETANKSLPKPAARLRVSSFSDAKQ
jgi:hypothetical protein